MLSDTSILLYLIYKIVTFLVGTTIIIFGFILFFKGFSAPAGNLEYSYFGKTIKISNAAPGIYLFLFGTLIIVLSMYKGVELKSHSKQNQVLHELTQENKVSVDTLNMLDKKLNIDSVINLAINYHNNGKLLNSFQMYCIAKGIAMGNDSISTVKKNSIEKAIKNLVVTLNDLAHKSSDIPLTTEETKSVTISEDQLDTTNK